MHFCVLQPCQGLRNLIVPVLSRPTSDNPSGEHQLPYRGSDERVAEHKGRKLWGRISNALTSAPAPLERNTDLCGDTTRRSPNWALLTTRQWQLFKTLQIIDHNLWSKYCWFKMFNILYTICEKKLILT